MTNLMDRYLDPKKSTSLGGVERYRRGSQMDKDKAREVLEGIDAYNVNKEARKKFKRNRIVVTNFRQQFQSDLADMQKFKDQNGGTTFLLCCVDCFSKQANIQPLKTKGGIHVEAGLKQAFKELGVPERFQVDKGIVFAIGRTIHKTIFPFFPFSFKAESTTTRMSKVF